MLTAMIECKPTNSFSCYCSSTLKMECREAKGEKAIAFSGLEVLALLRERENRADRKTR